MSILNLYCIKDNKVACFGKPFSEQNHIQAQRALHVAVNDKTIQIGMFPEDFDLYLVGTFNDQDGKITITPTPEFVVSAISLKKMEQNHA
nr:MAG: nonstructural protein [Microviridae sp.]